MKYAFLRLPPSFPQPITNRHPLRVQPITGAPRYCLHHGGMWKSWVEDLAFSRRLGILFKVTLIRRYIYIYIYTQVFTRPLCDSDDEVSIQYFYTALPTAGGFEFDLCSSKLFFLMHLKNIRCCDGELDSLWSVKVEDLGADTCF